MKKITRLDKAQKGTIDVSQYLGKEPPPVQETLTQVSSGNNDGR